MTFWNIGDEEPEDPRFIEAGPGACGLYFMAGASCMRRVRYRPESEIPPEWFVPDTWVKGWPDGARLASRLVDVGLWHRVAGGYLYAWIQPRNTAEAVRGKRKRERAKKAPRAGDSPGESAVIPLGTYRGNRRREPTPPGENGRNTPAIHRGRHDQEIPSRFPWGLPWGGSGGRYGYVTQPHHRPSPRCVASRAQPAAGPLLPRMLRMLGPASPLHGRSPLRSKGDKTQTACPTAAREVVAKAGDGTRDEP